MTGSEQVRRWLLRKPIIGPFDSVRCSVIGPAASEPTDVVSLSDLQREIAETRRQIDALMANAAAGTSHDLSYRIAVGAALTRFDLLADRLGIDLEEGKD